MEVKIGDSVITNDRHSYIVRKYKNVEEVDFKTREKTGEIKYKMISECYPSSLEQSLYKVISNELKSDDVQSARDILDKLKELKCEIMEYLNEVN